MSTSVVGASGQNFDVNSIVSGLMAIERRPLDAMQSRISSTQVSVSSMTEVLGLVDSTYASIKGLNSASVLRGKVVSSSNETLIKASVTDNSLVGVNTISVKPIELAKAQRSVLAGFGSASNPLLAADFGTLTVDVPSASTLHDAQAGAFTPVQIALGGQTLAQVRDAINSQLAGKVSASIINTGDPAVGYMLVLTGAKTGVGASFTASLDPPTLTAIPSSGLKLGSMFAAQASQTLGPSFTTTPVPYDEAPADAKAELFSDSLSAIQVQSSTNVFLDVVPGLKFELLRKPSVGEPGNASVTVAPNVAELQSKLSGFASSMTDLIKRLNVLTAPGSADKKAGPLASNAGVLSLVSSVTASYYKGFTLSDSRTFTTVAGNVIGGTTRPLAWSQLGLTMARNGTISFDASALNNTLSTELGSSILQGFDADLTSVFRTFSGAGGSVKATIDNIQQSLGAFQTRKSELESRVERTRQNLVKKYSALDAKLSQMNQMSANVRSSLAGLRV